jgi:hypothetical protein
VLLHVDQARVIVEALERIPASAMVPVEDLQVAEEELVKAGRHLSPGDLRKLGSQVRDRLDTDGSEPAEDKARQREALRMTNAEGGVKFNGFLAAENAELFTGAILAGSKPHKTVDGEPDPRPRDKRRPTRSRTSCTPAPRPVTSRPTAGSSHTSPSRSASMTSSRPASTPPVI